MPARTVKMDALEGQEFVFPNGRSTEPAMCRPARDLLMPHVQMVRARDRSHRVELDCPIVAGNKLAFDLRKKVAA
jgi:hypothetical protein